MKKTAIFDDYAQQKPMLGTITGPVTSHIILPQKGRVLDIGCGDGRFLEYCQQRATPETHVFGTEISFVRLQRCVDKGFSVAQTTSEKLPFADNSFDTIIFIAVIEHIHNPEPVVADIARILAPGGRLIVSTPNYPIKRVYDWISYLRGNRASPADDPTHFHPFSMRSLRRMCQAHFDHVEGTISRIPGENRFGFIKRLRNVPSIADIIGHKAILTCTKK